jgi:hypothetical protein
MKSMKFRYHQPSREILAEPFDASVAVLGDKPPDLIGSLLASAPELLTALQAIKARIDGEYDHPALAAFGSLSAECEKDIRAIACQAIGKVGIEVAAPSESHD